MTHRRRTIACLLCLLSVTICPSRVPAVVDVSGIIDSDTTWTAADTIHLAALVTINPGVQLTIAPGAVVQGELVTAFRVQGTLNAIGDNTNPIVMTCRADTSGGTPVAGGWTGIWGDGGDVNLRWCTIRYADRGVQVYGGSLEADDCLFENFLSYGVLIDGGASLPRTVHSVTNSIACQTDANLVGTGTGIQAGRYSDVTITRCRTDHCFYGVTFQSTGSVNPFFHVSECEISQNAFIGIYSYASG